MSASDGDDLYIDNYYELPSSQDRNRESGRNGTRLEPGELSPSWSSITRFLLTILLRIGFVLVQVGSVPVANVNLILLQNIVDFGCVTLVYTLAGYVIAYGGDLYGLMGQGQWIGHESTQEEEAITGWQAVAISSAICTSCIVGRTHTVGYLLIGTLMAGVLEPFVIHWAWTPRGWMSQNRMKDQNVAFRDYGASATVHLVGGLAGLIGCLVLGRRILRLRDIDDGSVSADSAGTTFAGYLLILLGLQSLCLTNTTVNYSSINDKHTSLVVVNNLLGASSCSLVVVGLHFFFSSEPFNHWTVKRCVQASVAGMVIVSAGVDIYTPILCIGLGCSGGIVFYLISRLVFQSALEDYCNIAATHLACALVGSLFAPFSLIATSADHDVYNALFNVAWQVICLVAIITPVAITMTVVFALLECLGLLRNRSEFVNHLRAVVALERGPHRSFMQRIFLTEPETLYLQPGTVPVERRGTVASQRFTNYERATVKLEKMRTKEIGETTQRSSESKIAAASSEPSTVHETRVKKLRQVHTMRLTSDVDDISEAAGHKEAMGDNLTPRVDCDKTDTDAENVRIQCHGDVADDRRTNDENVCKFELLDPGRLEGGVEKSLKRRREPYRLHRTEKLMNLRLEAISEHDENVEFLVLPRPRSFSSTSSESDDDARDITCHKYTRSFETSLGQTSDCSDTNL